MGALAAICDIDLERMLRYSRLYNVPGYQSLGEMLRREDLDAVVVSTPTSTHRDVALNVIEEGKHLLVEKPLAPTSQEAKEIVGRARRKGVILAVGYIERFNPAVRELRKLMEDGRLGEPLFAEFHRENRRPVRIIDVGILEDTVVHDIDTARLVFGEPESVYARLGRVLGPKDDYATVVLSFKGYKTAVLTANWVTPKRERRMTVVFSEAIASVDFVSLQLKIDDERGSWIPRIEAREPLRLELEDFVDAVSSGREPLVTGEDALKTTIIAEHASKSARTGAPVEVRL